MKSEDSDETNLYYAAWRAFYSQENCKSEHLKKNPLQENAVLKPDLPKGIFEIYFTKASA